MNRRSFLSTCMALAAAPAIVRAESLMPGRGHKILCRAPLIIDMAALNPGEVTVLYKDGPLVPWQALTMDAFNYSDVTGTTAITQLLESFSLPASPDHRPKLSVVDDGLHGHTITIGPITQPKRSISADRMVVVATKGNHEHRI